MCRHLHSSPYGCSRSGMPSRRASVWIRSVTVGDGGAQPARVRAVGVGGVGGGLRRVLRQVAGDLLRGQGPVRVVGAAGGRDRAGVELGAEPQPAHHVAFVQRRRVEDHAGGGLLDKPASSAAVRPAGRRGEPVQRLGSVEADEGVEVDDAALLVLGDLRVLHRHQVREPGSGTPRCRARARRRSMVNRRHSSGAHHCQTRWLS